MTLCPCDSGKAYNQCCEIYHLGKPAPTAEALMRSRYCAYALVGTNAALEDYLRHTWHPDTRPQQLNLTGEEAIKWLGLQVKSHQSIDDNHAMVTFVARYKYANNLSGKAERLQETSRFNRIKNQWYYIDGVHQ